MNRLPWIIAGAALLAALVAGAYAWRAGGRESAALEQARKAQAAQLHAEGFATETTKRASALEGDLDDAVTAWGERGDALAKLRAELARLQVVAPGSRVTGTRVAETPAGPAHGTPLPSAGAAASNEGAKPEATCLVRDGTPLKVRLVQADSLTPLGNVVPVGVGQCVRLLPEPAEVLREDLLTYTLAERAPDPAPDGCSWGSLATACAVCGGLGAAGGVYVGRR